MMEPFECKTRNNVAIGIERDESNVYDDSPTAIVMRVSTHAKVQDPDGLTEVDASPAYLDFAGTIGVEIEASFPLEEARAFHQALGEQIANKMPQAPS